MVHAGRKNQFSLFNAVNRTEASNSKIARAKRVIVKVRAGLTSF
jgi:hypothetical protein